MNEPRARWEDDPDDEAWEDEEDVDELDFEEDELDFDDDEVGFDDEDRAGDDGGTDFDGDLDLEDEDDLEDGGELDLGDDATFDALEADLELGDEGAELAGGVEVWCPYCGAGVEMTVDPLGGDVQEYVEDCEVCCQPWSVRVFLDPDAGASVELSTLDEG